jgi:hypothetical protein
LGHKEISVDRTVQSPIWTGKVLTGAAANDSCGDL